jgi:hypothetical protein
MPSVTTGAGGAAVDEPAAAPAAAPEQPRAVLPTDGFHDTREQQVAAASGVPTNEGYPLHPAAVQIIRELRKAVAGQRSWADWAEAQIARAEKIAAGG